MQQGSSPSWQRTFPFPTGTRRLRGAEGQAIAEFVLVIPFFFFLLLGVVQFSLLYLAYQVVHYAAFSAARAAIVRPCAAIHPDDQDAENFTPAVFSAAVFATMSVAPASCLVNGGGVGGAPNPCRPSDLGPDYGFLPDLPDSPEVEELDFDERAGTGEIAWTKYVNAAYLTSVQRVWSSPLGSRPVVWTPYDPGPGPGIPCDDTSAQQQNVPPTGSDISLEVTFLYPMTVPLVNRVIYGIFVNFSSLAQDRLNLGKITGPEGRPEDVMILPTRALAPLNRQTRFLLDVDRMFRYFGYGSGSLSRVGAIVDGLASRAWFPIPVRARCTLTVEGAALPLTGPEGRRGW